MRFGGILTIISYSLLSATVSWAQGNQAPDKQPSTRFRTRQSVQTQQQYQPGPAAVSLPVAQVRQRPDPRPSRVKEYSWIYIDAPEPREVKVNDIVTIIVDEKSEVTMNSRFNRQRTEQFTAELKEFIRLEGLRLGNVAQTEPTIDTALQERLQTTGQLIDQEGVRYRIAATVVDVQPNGNIILEARKMIRSNQELWEYTLTGTLRSIDISQNNTALSENIANLNIKKTQKGKVYDSTKRRWGTFLIDIFWPF